MKDCQFGGYQCPYHNGCHKRSQAEESRLKNGKNSSQIIAKMAIFGQAVPYIGSKSNYCQKWQYLDKSSSNMDAKSCQKWQKNVEQKLPILATEHSSESSVDYNVS